MATQAVRSRRGQSCAAAGGVGGKSSSRSRRWSQARAASAQTSLSLLLDRRASSDIRRTRSAGMRTCAGSTGIETRIDSATTGSYVAEVQRHVGPALADDMPGAAAADDTETGRTGSETGQAPEASALASGSRGMGASQVIGGLLVLYGAAQLEHLFYYCIRQKTRCLVKQDQRISPNMADGWR